MPFCETELEFAKSSSLLRDIPARAAVEIEDSPLTTQLILSPGDIFVTAGKVEPGLFLIVRGVVELFTTDEAGKEIVVDFMQPGNTLGEETLFTKQSMPYSARSLTETAVLHLPKELIVRWQKLYHRFSRQLLSRIALRADYVGKDMLTLCTKRTAARLVCYVLCHFNRAPRTSDGTHVIDFPFPRGRLASRLGITQSHLSRTLKTLQGKQLIIPRGRGYFIPDVPRLSQYVCPAGCDFKEEDS